MARTIQRKEDSNSRPRNPFAGKSVAGKGLQHTISTNSGANSDELDNFEAEIEKNIYKARTRPSFEDSDIHPDPEPIGVSDIESSKNYHDESIAAVRQEIEENCKDKEDCRETTSGRVKEPETLKQLGRKIRKIATLTKKPTILPISDHLSYKIERIATDRQKKIIKKRTPASIRLRKIFCKLCEIHVNSNQFREHCQGKKHERSLRKEEEKHLDLSCKICNVNCRTKNDYLKHIKSNKHTFLSNNYLN